MNLLLGESLPFGNFSLKHVFLLPLSETAVRSAVWEKGGWSGGDIQELLNLKCFFSESDRYLLWLQGLIMSLMLFRSLFFNFN